MVEAALARTRIQNQYTILCNRTHSISPSSITTKNSPHQHIWDEMYDRLCAFKERYGSCLVPRHFEDDQKLGRWVDQQRVKNKKGTLPPDRKNQLDSLGFMWKMR